MMQTLTRVYDDYTDAQSVVRALREAGIPEPDISLVSNHAGDGDGSATQDGVATGATVGGALGAGAGLLSGLGLMAIPGVGPVVAAGWLAAMATGAVAGAATGAAAGGIIGALTNAGVTSDEAHMYAEGVRRGGSLVSVRVSDDNRSRAVDIMDEYEPADIEQRRSTWQSEGWTEFDPAAKPYSSNEISRERQRYMGS